MSTSCAAVVLPAVISSSMRNKTTNQCLSNGRKKIKEKKKQSLAGSLLKCITKEEIYKRLFGNAENNRKMPLRRAAAVLVSVAVSAPFLTFSDCAGGKLPGVNSGKAAKEAAWTGAETWSSTVLQQLGQLITTKTGSYHCKSKSWGDWKAIQQLCAVDMDTLS